MYSETCKRHTFLPEILRGEPHPGADRGRARRGGPGAPGVHPAARRVLRQVQAAAPAALPRAGEQARRLRATRHHGRLPVSIYTVLLWVLVALVIGSLSQYFGCGTL